MNAKVLAAIIVVLSSFGAAYYLFNDKQITFDLGDKPIIRDVDGTQWIDIPAYDTGLFKIMLAKGDFITVDLSSKSTVEIPKPASPPPSTIIKENGNAVQIEVRDPDSNLLVGYGAQISKKIVFRVIKEGEYTIIFNNKNLRPANQYPKEITLQWLIRPVYWLVELYEYVVGARILSRQLASTVYANELEASSSRKSVYPLIVCTYPPSEHA